MKSYIDDIVVVDPLGEEAILYPRTKQEAVENLPERFANLEIPDITTTTSTTQPNSYAGREMVLEIGGVMEQDSTAGNQLWNGKYVTNALNKEQDNFVADSTMAGNIAMPVEVGKQYTLSINGSLAVMRYAFLGSEGNYVTSLTNATTTVVAPENAVYMKWRVNSYHAETDKIMLNEGTTALPYEKYTGGIPAPNPNYPMPIKNSKVSGVRTHWNNFLENTTTTTTKNGVTFTVNDDGTVTANGTATADTAYNIQSNNVPISSEMYSNVIQLSGSYTGTIQHRAFDSNFSNNVTGALNEPKLLKSGIKYSIFRFTIYSGTVCNNLKLGFMVAEEGYDTYEPYTSSECTFSQPIDLYGMNGVQDIITPQPINRRFAKRVFDGSESWLASSTQGKYYVNEVGGKEYGIGLCSHAKMVSNYSDNTNECYFSANGRFVICTSFATLEEWTAHLAEKPMEVVYKLAEEVTEELPIADQIALNSLATYDGITYVEFIYDELEPTFKGKYGTSEVGGMTLESLLVARNNELKQDLANERLSALEASVVNNI